MMNAFELGLILAMATIVYVTYKVIKFEAN
jgi:hypothetical protein